MADWSHSWLFSISQDEIERHSSLLGDQTRLRQLREDDAQKFLSNHEPNAFYGTSRRYFVESWILQNSDSLPGLSYVERGFALMGAAEIKLALRDIQRALETTIPNEDWSFWYLEALSIDDALTASTDVLLLEDERYGSIDHDNPYYLIAFLREHQRIFHDAIGRGENALYILYDYG